MILCFVQNFFFGQHESQNIYFFCRAKHEFFFPEFNIRLYDKNSESYYFFSLHQNQNIFFQQHWESEYFFQKKNIEYTCLYVHKLEMLKTAYRHFCIPKKSTTTVLQHVKKSLYNQPKPYFWIDFNKFYTKTFRIVYILIVYLLIMFI